MLNDEDVLWRRCEDAWARWLEQDGNAVTRLTDAAGNTPRSEAPLTSVAGRLRRSPDLLATKLGQSQYWEVKARSRADVDPLTGQREHWMDYAAFRDYLSVSVSAQMRVWVILYEVATAVSPGRWLRIDVRLLKEVGHVDQRRGADGELKRAWAWPASEMEVVAGPEVAVTEPEEPLLPSEGEGQRIGADELEPVERVLRRRRRTAAAPVAAEVVDESDFEGPRVTPSELHSTNGTAGSGDALPLHWLWSEPALALDVLRRSLGIPRFPRYSVLRVGVDGVDLDDVLGLLHYGVRVFLVSADEPEHGLDDTELSAFKDSRLLEWAVVPEAAGCSQWIVDGSIPSDMPEEVSRALSAADDSGQLNFAQYQVVHASSDEDVVVTAGAGTGKTETMSERIIFLLAMSGTDVSTPGAGPHDLRADEIALVTFTRESAAEMRSRIARSLLLRQRLCRRCTLPALAWMLQLSVADIATIHSLAKRITATGAGLLGLGPGFRVARRTMEFREATYRALSDRLTALIDRYGSQVPAAYEWQRHVEAVWEALQNNGVDLLLLSSGSAGKPDVDWGEAAGPGLDAAVVEATREAVEEIARRTREACLETQTLPTNQLVPSATAALQAQDAPPVRQYRYVFVDEFQDTDAAQMELLLELRTRLDCRLFVVGDAKQGIYRFRGAEGNAFEEMDRRVAARGLDPMRSFGLTRNFRAGKRLLDSLHPYFRAWGDARLLPYASGDRLLPQPQEVDDSREVTVEGVNPSTFATDAAARVARWRTLAPGGSVGILCRENWQAVKVQQAVRERQIPCELRVGGSFFESPAVRELRVLLEAVADTSDDAALLELCETRWAAGILLGEPPSEVEVAWWGEDHGAPVAWSPRFATVHATGSFQRDDLDALRQRVGSLRMMLNHMPTLAWVVECARAFQPEACEMPGDDDETERRRYGRCLDHLVTLLDAQFRDGPTTLERLLAWLRLQVATNRSEDEPDVDTDGKVVALTVHKAKGHEFDRVLLPITWTQFGPPKSLATRTSVLREPGGPPRLLWKWRPSHNQGTYSNVPPNRAHEWVADDRDTAMEETRLLYVAMTRAKEELAVFYGRDAGGTLSSATSWSQLLLSAGV